MMFVLWSRDHKGWRQAGGGGESVAGSWLSGPVCVILTTSKIKNKIQIYALEEE